MKVQSRWLRRIHKWVGLVIGLQVVLWTVSGAGMAWLDRDAVAGGREARFAAPAVTPSATTWPRIQAALAGQEVTGLTLQPLPWGQAVLVTTPRGPRLFDPASGTPVAIGARQALLIASAAHPDRASVAWVQPLRTVTLAVRGHRLPIWEVRFRDAGNSSYYVSAVTGAVLERRNDSWRLWDILWMLHTMDYAERTSFNHPLIITIAFALTWLATTGFWLLFRTGWRHDLRGAGSWAGERSDLLIGRGFLARRGRE